MPIMDEETLEFGGRTDDEEVEVLTEDDLEPGFKVGLDDPD